MMTMKNLILPALSAQRQQSMLRKLKMWLKACGKLPKVVPTFPELTCHSVHDLEILRSRPRTAYQVSDEVIQAYREIQNVR